MTSIYVLTARDKSTYSVKPTKVLRAFANEILATEAKQMIEECEPRLEVEVITVQLVGSIAAPAANPVSPVKTWSAFPVGAGYQNGPPTNDLANALAFPPHESKAAE